jgi:hypothetical protein
MNASELKEYGVWAAMKRRCYNPNCRQYRWYGARGVTVAAKWVNNFWAFYADMGPRPEGATIERKDNQKGYSAENCVWASRKIQARNTRGNKLIAHAGRVQSLAAWAEELGIPYARLQARITVCGMTISEAFAHKARLRDDGQPQKEYQIGDYSLTISGWAKQTGIKYATIWARLRKGATIEEAVGYQRSGLMRMKQEERRRQ